VTITEQDAAEVVGRLAQTPGFEGAHLAGPPRPLAGGFWAEIVVLPIDVRGSHQEVVLRRMPDAAYGAKEAAFQLGVAQAGFPVPRVHRFDAHPPSGRAELLMDLVPGSPPLSGLDGPAALMRLPVLARRIPDLLATVMAQLHGVDPACIADAVARSTTTSPTSLPEVLGALAQGANALERQDLVKVITALRADAPQMDHVVVCHGDLHPFNVLVDGETWGLLDWTAAVIAPPAYDVTFTRLLLRHPPLTAPRPLAPVISASGAAIARRFLKRYGAAAGTRRSTPAELNWFTAVHATRILLEVEGWQPDGATADHVGHPWLTIGPIAARRLTTQTGVEVRWTGRTGQRASR
jgi:aminoglycoside phosphotransferase (APT) family kinase protein